MRQYAQSLCEHHDDCGGSADEGSFELNNYRADKTVESSHIITKLTIIIKHFKITHCTEGKKEIRDTPILASLP